MTVIGIGGLAFGWTVGEVGFAAVTSFRNGGPVAAVVRIAGFAFGLAGCVVLLAAIGARSFVRQAVARIVTPSADVGRIDADISGFAGAGFVTVFSINKKIFSTGCVGGGSQTSAVNRTGQVLAVAGIVGSGIGAMVGVYVVFKIIREPINARDFK